VNGSQKLGELKPASNITPRSDRSQRRYITPLFTPIGHQWFDSQVNGQFNFKVGKTLPNRLGRTGVITTAHG